MHRDLRVERLAEALARYPPRRVADSPRLSRAAVALVVRPEPDDLEVLLIKRAPRTGDPWSGHMALPGGRQDPGDPDPLTTAMRETLEEVDINLRAAGRYLGALDEVQPQSASLPSLVISPFAFAIAEAVPATPNAEVAAAFWVPLRELASDEARALYRHELPGGGSLHFPALACRGQVIWGLTYRIVTQFLALAKVSQEASG